MTTPVPSHSATIYQFRPKAVAHDVRAAKPVPDQVQPAALVLGGSWYHEAAIQAERANKP